MGGAVIGSNRFYNLLMLYRKDFGGVLSPKNAWPILVYGLPTLATRMVNQQKGAMMVANFLLKQSKVARVVYPGLPNFPQAELARRQMVGYDGKFAPGSLLYFERSEEHTSELQSPCNLVCHLLLEKKKKTTYRQDRHSSY